MPKPPDELLNEVKKLVQEHPNRVPDVLQAVGRGVGETRAAIEHLVQRGELEFDVQMKLRATDG